jgi:hypothetical protein
MAAPPRFEHQNERGIFVDVDFVNGIHHDRDL